MYGTGVIVTMDYQVLFNIALGLAGAFGGWTLNTITSNLRQATSDIRAVEARIQETRETYVSKVDHAAELAKFEHRFDRIDDKLERILTAKG